MSDSIEKRIELLEQRVDLLDAKEIRRLRSIGWSWKRIHEWRFAHLSAYKVRKLGRTEYD